MPAEYSVEVCRRLEDVIRASGLHRPMRIARYDAGQELVYDVAEVGGTNKGQVRLLVEKFVGGGFAGQVYRVKVLGIKTEGGPIEGVNIGGVYAMKILVPPSRLSRFFRDTLYWIGFMGPFQLQVNPAALRASALWQKFIRRGAKIRFADENCIADAYATFVDSGLGSCGELGEWVDGRTWRLEVDDRLDLLSQWRRDQKKIENRKSKIEDSPDARLGSPEYRAKRQFMARFVQLIHDMGWHEFARQYEWSTWKSQPNCLKRRNAENDPSAGLVAVDFRAGLALLPFLPMSPGDFKLIATGIMRGSLVQFDRGDVHRLDAFVRTHSDQFGDMGRMLDELKAAEQIYRNSLVDITHNHIRLLYSGKLWSTILDSAVAGWKVRNFVDENYEWRLRSSKILTLVFLAIGLIPFLGKFLRRIWARPDWRRHYAQMLMSWGYLQRAVGARIAEKVIIWHRAGRVDVERALKLASGFWRFLCHLPLSALPAKLHRFLTDWNYAKQRLAYLIIRPIRLYFNAEMRERWLREMITEGQRKQMLSDEDAQTILRRIKEPFIQKYLKSLAVHLCTLPVTQAVSVSIAVIYVLTHPEVPRAQAWGIGLGIIALFQVVPISPGSLVRGLYVLYLVIRERNFKDYNIAVVLGFFKYIGYLAFPIQMTYRYPALARFMAGHWATEAAHLVPVFGEMGALLEHGVFYLFYNWPLTIRRRMHKRGELRASIRPRYWHVGLCAVAAAAIFGLADFAYFTNLEKLPSLKDIWWLVLALPVAGGAAVTLGCGGAAFGRRIVAAAVCGVLAALFYTMISGVLMGSMAIVASSIIISGAWRMFIFAVLAAIGAIATELKLPEPHSE